MKKLLFMMLCLFAIMEINSKSIGANIWNLIVGKPHKVSVEQLEVYIKDCVIAAYANKYGHRPSTEELNKIYARVAVTIFLTKDQLNDIDHNVKSAVKNFSQYEPTPRPFHFQPPAYVQSKKITWSQVPEYIGVYITQKFNILYDPRDIQNYDQMVYTIQMRARQEAMAGTTNDGLQIVDELVWIDILNNIIEQESYVLIR